MSVEDIKNMAIYICLMVGVSLCIWWAGSFFAKSVSDYEVISPKDGVECVVVSRMFNTSVDCWNSIKEK